MTISETLQTDHRQVKVLLETILSTNDAKKRGDLFKQFRTELTAHSRAEEMVLYRRMEKSEEGKDDALEGAVEHEIVDRLMEDLSRSRSVGSDKWTARCTVLQELLEHHIDEEEGEFFKIAWKIFDRETLAKMGTAFTARKPSLRALSPENEPPRRASSIGDLGFVSTYLPTLGFQLLVSLSDNPKYHYPTGETWTCTMKTTRQTGTDLRKVTKTPAVASTNLAKGAELAMASSRVVSKRAELGVAAIANPLQAEHRELERIIPEKTKAFSASNAVLIRGLGEMAEQAASFVINEMAIATRMTSELALCRTPAAVLGLQSRLAMEWYGRVFSQYIELAALAVRSQGAMVSPVHRAATDNARRLNA